jgi:hypothetical protein
MNSQEQQSDLEQRLKKCEKDIALLQGIISRMDLKDESVFKNQFSKYYDPKKFYYVCSFGGCGSTPLTKYLANFGNTFHVHSREPPDKLTYVGKYLSSNPGSHPEWFNGVPVNEEDLPNCKVIYLYRDPIRCLYSRFIHMNRPDNPEKNHIFNIQCPRKFINLKDVAEQRQDLYRLEDFFDNYTRPNNNRNYEIIPLEYNKVFDDFPAFNKLLNLPNDDSLIPEKRETKREPYYEQELREVYKTLCKKMQEI